MRRAPHELLIGSLLGPRLGLHIVDVSIVVLVPVRVNLVVFAQEGALVECVLVRQVARLCDLILLRVEHVRGIARGAVLLSSEYQDVLI